MDANGIVVTACCPILHRQNGHNLTVSKFRCSNAESPAYTLREDSTFKSYF